jgi:hypothetical protein
MTNMAKLKEDKYEIIIKRCGVEDPVETDIMDDWETQEVLYLIGQLNSRKMYVD